MKRIGGEVPTNGAKNVIEGRLPYLAQITIQGSADLLFHRWNVEGIEEKSKAAKGSRAKKSDDLETFVYRNEQGFICIPSEYFRQSIINAAKFKQDPRSPRKSAMDLYKAGLIIDNPLASLGIKEWDYIDKRRVVVQRNGITRSRPALHKGWECEFLIQVLIPEYIDADSLRETIDTSGRLVGIGDFRPTYGRFGITKFEINRFNEEPR